MGCLVSGFRLEGFRALVRVFGLRVDSLSLSDVRLRVQVLARKGSGIGVAGLCKDEDSTGIGGFRFGIAEAPFHDHETSQLFRVGPPSKFIAPLRSAAAIRSQGLA